MKNKMGFYRNIYIYVYILKFYFSYYWIKVRGFWYYGEMDEGVYGLEW